MPADTHRDAAVLGDREFFADLMDRQRDGQGVRLVAWVADRPVGHVFLALGEDAARRLGHQRIALAAGLDNAEARSLYERLGYVDWRHGHVRGHADPIGLHHCGYGAATMVGPLWAWIRGLQHWERVRRPPTPAQEDAAFQARVRAGQAEYERLHKALDELPNRQHASTTEDDEDPPECRSS